MTWPSQSTPSPIDRKCLARNNEEGRATTIVTLLAFKGCTLQYSCMVQAAALGCGQHQLTALKPKHTPRHYVKQSMLHPARYLRRGRSVHNHNMLAGQEGCTALHSPAVEVLAAAAIACNQAEAEPHQQPWHRQQLY